jgi:hypothetical protein
MNEVPLYIETSMPSIVLPAGIENPKFVSLSVLLVSDELFKVDSEKVVVSDPVAFEGLAQVRAASAPSTAEPA